MIPADFLDENIEVNNAEVSQEGFFSSITDGYTESLMPGWIQNRANTLATWCMFAQVFPLFQVDGIFATLPVLYKYTGATTGMELSHFTLEQMNAAGAYPVAQGVMSILAVVANVICIAVIIKRAIEQKKNPYKNEIFAGTKDFEEAMDRA